MSSAISRKGVASRLATSPFATDGEVPADMEVRKQWACVSMRSAGHSNPGVMPWRRVQSAARERRTRSPPALRLAECKFGPFAEGWDIHEVHPVKFGGSPTDLGNKVAILPAEHWQISAFWKALQRELTNPF